VSEPDSEGSLIEHLVELRSRLVRALAGVGIVLLACCPSPARCTRGWPRR
jgi:sec-independent protein translocase protein TatC